MLITMNLKAMITTLTAIQAAEEPTTKKTASALAKRAEAALGELADWLDDIRSAVDEASLATEELGDCDGDDREDNHQRLIEELGAVIDTLTEDIQE